MSEYQKSLDEFCLLPPEPKQKKRYLPEQVIGLEVATPLEQIVTVIVLVKGEHGEVMRVPIGWTPSTNVIKRMNKKTWAELGIEKDIAKIRNSALKIAKSLHKKAVLKYATYDMFETENVIKK
jgi:hypothetical protein